jgi:hypothetical protein
MQPSKQDSSLEEHVLDADIAAFEKLREELEREHLDEFALFFEGKFEAVFPNFDSAGRAALARFGSGPYLIQQIGSPIGLDADTAMHGMVASVQAEAES